MIIQANIRRKSSKHVQKNGIEYMKDKNGRKNYQKQLRTEDNEKIMTKQL